MGILESMNRSYTPTRSRVTHAPTPMQGYGGAPLGQGGSEMPYGRPMSLGYGMAPLGQRIAQMMSPSTGQRYDLSPQQYSQYVGRQFQQQMGDMREAGYVPDVSPGPLPVLQQWAQGSGVRRGVAADSAYAHAQPYVNRSNLAGRSYGAVDYQSPLAGYPTQRDPFTGALAGQDPWQGGQQPGGMGSGRAGLAPEVQLDLIRQWQQQGDGQRFGSSTLQPSPAGTGGMALVGPGTRDPLAMRAAHEGIARRFGVSAQDYGMPELKEMAQSERQATLQSRERSRLQHLGGDRARQAYDDLLAGNAKRRETRLASTGQSPATAGISLPSAAASPLLTQLGITAATSPTVIRDLRNRAGLTGAQRQALRELADERQRELDAVRRKKEQDREDWAHRLG